MQAQRQQSLLTVIVAIVQWSAASQGQPAFPDTTTQQTNNTEASRRADELLRKMTVEEKAMQLSSVFPLALFDTNGPIGEQLDAQLKHGIGHVSALGLIGHKAPETLAKSVNAAQGFRIDWHDRAKLSRLNFASHRIPARTKLDGLSFS